MGDRKIIQKRLDRARWRVGWDLREHEAALTKAAEFYGLDPKKPSERERLLYTNWPIQLLVLTGRRDTQRAPGHLGVIGFASLERFTVKRSAKIQN